MLQLRATRQFREDLKKASHQGQGIDALEAVIGFLQHGRMLDEKYEDHALIGTWKDHCECNIAPDWLLIYKSTYDELRLIRLGSHSERY